MLPDSANEDDSVNSTNPANPAGVTPDAAAAAGPATPLAGRRLSVPAFRQAVQEALASLASPASPASPASSAGGLPDRTGSAAARPVVALLVVSLERSDRIACLLDDAAARVVTAQLCGRIASMLRDADSFALISPDEVWLLLPRLRAQALVLLAVNRLSALLEAPFVDGGGAVFVRPSIGVACAPDHAGAVLPLLRAADQARQAARGRQRACGVRAAARRRRLAG